MSALLDPPAAALARARPRRLAAAWAAATLASAAALAAGPGVSRDEAAALAAASRVAAPLGGAALLPAAAERAGAPRPPLSDAAAGIAHAVLSRAGLQLGGFRAAAALFAAALSFALALLAFDLGGPALALLAPALFWVVPRDLQQAVVATPDLPEAALWVATALAWRRSLLASGRDATRWALWTGLLFGAAAATRADGWLLLPVLALHAAASGSFRGGAVDDGRAPRRPRLPPALVAMATLGPAVVAVATAPLWVGAPAGRALTAFLPRASGAAWTYLGAAVRGPRPPLLSPAVVAALTVPAPVLAAIAAGLLHSGWRLSRALRRDPAASVGDESLLLLGAVGPLALAAAGLAPTAPGARPWLPAMPFLAIAGGRALLAAARTLRPAHARETALALSLLALWPAARAAAHAWPLGASAWNELAGGAPGAASVGMQRQDGGEAVRSALPALSAHAVPGARVWWPGVAPEAIAAYRSSGALRPDLADAAGPEDADVAVVPVDGASRDDEYRAWTAFRSATPVSGVYLDEVPLVLVYARPGAWR